MQATILEDVDLIADTLAGTLGAGIETGRGLNGYRASRVIKRDGETLARVLFGGNGNPHLIATGAATDEVVPVLRAAWSGEHDVSRMDSAQDFEQVGGYDRLRGVMLAKAESAKLSTLQMESTRNLIRSRTTYLGSPSSRVRVRLYEKGCFEHQMGHSDASLDWVRLEAQIRPSGLGRRIAAELDPAGAWGFAAWTRDLARDALGVNVERVTSRPRREPDYMRAVRALRRQYGATLAEVLEVEGSWDAVGRLLGMVDS